MLIISRASSVGRRVKGKTMIELRISGQGKWTRFFLFRPIQMINRGGSDGTIAVRDLLFF